MVIYLILKITLWNQAWVGLFIPYSHIPDEGSETQEASPNSLSATLYPYIFIPSLIYYLLPVLSFFLILYLIYPLIIPIKPDMFWNLYYCA